jgi:hypothetical protein
VSTTTCERSRRADHAILIAPIQLRQRRLENFLRFATELDHLEFILFALLGSCAWKAATLRCEAPLGVRTAEARELTPLLRAPANIAAVPSAASTEN